MTLHPSAQKVQQALEAQGFAFQVVELPASTRSAQDAAEAIGCRVEHIAKALVFKGRRTGRPILVIASGRNRVNEDRLAELAGEPIDKPDADYVRQQTGFAIGGVPPVGHRQPLLTLIDADLGQLDTIWAAAGTSHAVFCLTPDELVRLTGGQVAIVS